MKAFCNLAIRNSLLGFHSSSEIQTISGPGLPRGFESTSSTRALMPATEDAVQKALASDSLSQAAIAVPLFGTTLSHYAVLCDEMGFEELKAWHRSLRDRGIREARGNGAVKDLVAEGACQFGFTDTDDVFVAIDQGKPVRMLPVRLKSGKTICLPNSVAKIKVARIRNWQTNLFAICSLKKLRSCWPIRRPDKSRWDLSTKLNCLPIFSLC
jgi:hypothetical protein